MSSSSLGDSSRSSLSLKSKSPGVLARDRGGVGATGDGSVKKSMSKGSDAAAARGRLPMAGAGLGAIRASSWDHASLLCVTEGEGFTESKESIVGVD